MAKKYSTTDPAFLAIRHGMEYIMHHPHETIVYSRKKSSKQMKYHINASSNKAIQKSTKIRNTLTPSIHIVMQIMQGIFITEDLTHQQLTSSMVPSLDGAPRNNLKHIEAVKTKKQEKFTQKY